MTGITVLGLVTVHPVGLRKRTFIVLGLIVSTVPTKLALPLSLHLLLLSPLLSLEKKIVSLCLQPCA